MASLGNSHARRKVPTDLLLQESPGTSKMPSCTKAPLSAMLGEGRRNPQHSPLQ